MDTYIRFQTQLRCANTGRPAGLFVAAGRLEDSGRLAQSMHELLREHLTWFNDNLAVPSIGGRGWRCVFWFRSHATQFISRMWDLAAILNEVRGVRQETVDDQTGNDCLSRRFSNRSSAGFIVRCLASVTEALRSSKPQDGIRLPGEESPSTPTG